MDIVMRIQSGLSVHMNPTQNLMRIKCTLRIALFCSALAMMLGKKKACFLMAKKSGTAW